MLFLIGGLDGTHITTTGSNLAAVLQRTGMSGFSQFAVGGQSNLSLPVTLLSFSGYKDGSRNQLSWITASELNNRGFEVQRSTDGVNYTAIGFLNSLANGGNSNDQLSYRFTDNTPAGGSNTTACARRYRWPQQAQQYCADKWCETDSHRH